MADANKIEVGDTVSVMAFAGVTPIQAVVISLPDNQLEYWRMRTTLNNFILYVSVNAVPLVQLISKA